MQIGRLHYTKHAAERMEQRGVAPWEVEDCLHFGAEIQTGVFKLGSVVVSYRDGVVITTFIRHKRRGRSRRSSTSPTHRITTPTSSFF